MLVSNSLPGIGGVKNPDRSVRILPVAKRWGGGPTAKRLVEGPRPCAAARRRRPLRQRLRRCHRPMATPQGDRFLSAVQLHSSSVQPIDYICSRIADEAEGRGSTMAERASESEMQILSALWDESPQSATDLAENVGAANGWTLATVKTLVARLVQKGAVTAEAEGRRFLYSPAV